MECDTLYLLPVWWISLLNEQRSTRYVEIRIRQVEMIREMQYLPSGLCVLHDEQKAMSLVPVSRKRAGGIQLVIYIKTCCAEVPTWNDCSPGCSSCIVMKFVR